MEGSYIDVSDVVVNGEPFDPSLGEIDPNIDPTTGFDFGADLNIEAVDPNLPLADIDRGYQDVRGDLHVPSTSDLTGDAAFPSGGVDISTGLPGDSVPVGPDTPNLGQLGPDPNITSSQANTFGSMVIQKMGERNPADAGIFDRYGVNAEGQVYDVATGLPITPDNITPAQQADLKKVGDAANESGKILGLSKEQIWAGVVTLGMGGIGMLAGNLFAPTPPKLQVPPPIPPPVVNQLGQGALVNALTGKGGPSTSATIPPKGGGGSATIPGAGGGAAVPVPLGGTGGYTIIQENPDGSGIVQDQNGNQFNWNPANPDVMTPMAGAGGQAGGPSPLVANRPQVDISQLGPSEAGAAADLESVFRLGMAGQRNVADTALGQSARELGAQVEQAPEERAIRLSQLEQIPGLTGPTRTLAPTLATGQRLSGAIGETLADRPQEGTYRDPAQVRDPISEGLRAQIQAVMGGDLPTPELTRSFLAEEQQLRNELMKAHGPGYETSSPGIEAIQKLRESQDVRRQQYKMQTLSSLVPMEETRRQFNIREPESKFTGRLAAFMPGELQRASFAEDVQGKRLGQATGLAQGLGRVPGPQTSTTLSSLVPIQSVLGLDAAGNAVNQQNQLQNQAALEAFRAGGQSSSETASSIAKLFATAGGTAVGSGGGQKKYSLVPD